MGIESDQGGSLTPAQYEALSEEYFTELRKGDKCDDKKAQRILFMLVFGAPVLAGAPWLVG